MKRIKNFIVSLILLVALAIIVVVVCCIGAVLSLYTLVTGRSVVTEFLTSFAETLQSTGDRMSHRR